jgi:hypothetical protein
VNVKALSKDGNRRSRDTQGFLVQIQGPSETCMQKAEIPGDRRTRVAHHHRMDGEVTLFSSRGGMNGHC